MSPPSRTGAPGSKMRWAVTLPAATVAGEQKNGQIYIIKWPKKMCSGRKGKSQDLVLAEEHTASSRKFKNVT
jgi:hypothetical protein